MERSTDVYNIHYNQYLHNKNFISKGINNQCENFYDWEITVDFYAAIHLIEAVLSLQCGIHEVCTHQDRSRYLNNNNTVFSRRLITKYNSLQSISRTARYRGATMVDEDGSLQAQNLLEDIEFELKSYILAS